MDGINYGYLLNSPFITKKGDPSHPMIECSIGPQVFHNALCDLGSGVNIMSKITYDNLLGGPLFATFIHLQMAHQTIWLPEGLARDILVKIQEDYVPVVFMILDMEPMRKFLSSLEGHSSTQQTWSSTWDRGKSTSEFRIRR